MQEDSLEQEASWGRYLNRKERVWEDDEPLVRLGRALAEPMRIRILGLLARGSMFGQELAERLQVTPPTISRHIAVLRAAGLVRVQRERTTHYYHLDGEGLQRMARLLSVEELSRVTEVPVEQQGAPASAEPSQRERREIVLSVYFKDGRLMSIPASTAIQAEIRRTVMERVAQAFLPGKVYTEAEVNEILRAFNEDTASLRRALLDEQMLTRDRGQYWLTHHMERTWLYEN